MYEIADLLKTTQEISDVFLYIVFVFTTVTFWNIQIYKIHTFSTNVMLKYTKWWLKQPSAYPSHSSPPNFFFFFFSQASFNPAHLPKTCAQPHKYLFGRKISSRGLIQAVKAEKKSRLQLWEGNRLTKLMKYENAPMHHFSLSVATSMVSTTVPPFVLT